MQSELLKHPKALLFSVILHVVFLGIFFLNFNFVADPKLQKQGQVAKTVKAEIIDQRQLEALERGKQEEQEARLKKEMEKKKQAQAEKAQLEKKRAQAEKAKLEKKRAEAKKLKLAEERQSKAVANKKRKETARKLAEAKKNAELKKQQEAEVKRKAEEQKKKQLAEAKKKQERLEKLEQEKQAKLAEQERLEQEKKRQEAEKRRLAEQERKRQQAEIKAKLESEKNQRRLDLLRDAYRLAIKQKIERNWRQPQESGKMPDCEVRVIQGPGGIILDVTFGDCKGGSTTYRLSIVNAVYKADPLPKPGDAALFDRELIFFFTPG